MKKLTKRYEANGYKKFKQEAVTDELIFVYMEKM